MRRHVTLASIASPIASLSAYFLAVTCFLAFAPFAFASTETVLYDFTGNQGGGNPIFGMVFDSAGNLYGTTPAGGSGLSGNAFELSPNGDGGWNYTQIYSFSDCSAACYPQGPLTLDQAGNLYGVARVGGPSNNGCVMGQPTSAFQVKNFWVMIPVPPETAQSELKALTPQPGEEKPLPNVAAPMDMGAAEIAK
jgi:hypothetical protein